MANTSRGIARRTNLLKGISAKDVVARFLLNETNAQIAKSFDVTPTALSFWMLKHAEYEWKEAQIIKAMRRKDEAELGIDNSKNQLGLNRSKESLKAAQWDLERICRRIYGQDLPVQAMAAIRVDINLNRDQGQEQIINEEHPQIENETGT